MMTTFLMAAAIAGQSYTTVVDFASLLSLNHFAGNGAIQVQHLYSAFPETGGKYSCVVRDVSQEYGRYDLEALPEIDGVFARMEPMNGGNGVIVMQKAGNYTLDFYHGDSLMSTMDFSIRTFTAGDEYSGKTYYLFDGPWRKYGAFVFRKEKTFVFRIWSSTSEIDSTKQVELTMTILNNGKVVGTSKKKFASKYEWKGFDFAFDKTDGKSALMTDDFKKMTGTLEVVLKINGQRSRSFTTTIKDGLPVGLSEQAMEFSPRAKHLLPKTLTLETNEHLRTKMQDLVWLSTSK